MPLKIMAIAWLSLKKEGSTFHSFQDYANEYKFPMLVLLSMTYATGHIRQHLFGIVPLTVDNEIHMHIVEGCHPPKKQSL
jgi:hypothetical protein